MESYAVTAEVFARRGWAMEEKWVTRGNKERDSLNDWFFNKSDEWRMGQRSGISDGI